MLVKTFKAATAAEALGQVRDALGPRAAVLETRRAPGGVEVLAMAERPRAGEPRVAASLPRAPLVSAAASLRDTLVVQGFSSAVAERIAAAAQANLDEIDLCDARAALAYARTLIALLLPSPTSARRPGAELLALVGAPGVGKTTTAAKIAARERGPRGGRVVVATADDHRLGGAEQMRAFSRVLGLPYRLVRDGRELAAARAEAGDGGLVLLDTPGVSSGDDELLARLGRLLSGARPEEIELLLAADTEPDALARMVRRFRSLRPGAVGATRADEAVRRGGLASAVVSAGLPFVHLSSGPDVSDGLELAAPERFAAWAIPGEAATDLRASLTELLR